MKFRECYKSGERALTRLEYDKLLSVVDRFEDRVCFVLAVNTGVRREDLCGILWSNINEKEGCITFYESKKRNFHTVYVNGEVLQMLKIYRNMLGKEAGKTIIPYVGRTAYRRLQFYCEKAGIPKRPFHSLRATCIKFCQSSGWKPEETAKHVNDSLRVIQEHYSVPSNAEMKETAQNKPITPKKRR